MKRITTIAALASAAALAPTAFGAGTPLPPIDAGSNQPNPLYTHKIPPIDAGSDEINPAYYFDPVTQTVRPVHPAASSGRPAVAADSGDFGWRWAGIGSALALSAGAAVIFVLRRRVTQVSQA
jgi:hypothetical protein